MQGLRVLIPVLLCSAAAPALAGGCLDYAGTALEQAIVRTESSGNQFAIGVVGGRLARQPRSLQEAVATADYLRARGFDFSMGCRQVNQSNLARYGLDHHSVFDPRRNSAVGNAIFYECSARAVARFGAGDSATRAALSCYYSGNFRRGQQPEGRQPSYVDRVLARAGDGPGARAGFPPVRPVRAPPSMIPAPVASTAPAPSDTPVTSWDVFNELQTASNLTSERL